MYQRDDYDHLFKVFDSSSDKGPMEFYSTTFYNLDVYDKSDDEIEDFEPIADIYFRLDQNQV